jgi:hypothetical protein
VRTSDLLATIVAGALGAAVGTYLMGASLILVLPAALGVGIVSVVADRSRRLSR